ncbi:MAG TPA: hypothetical protein VGS07_27090 [Thermoanaerobaculia bacterium]|jgi:hypothetical protein|nr:hypothetical protein [Thermoanaerobaculia bacterium]
MDRLELAWLVRGVGILSLLVIAVGAAMPRPAVSAEAKKALGDLGFRGPVTGIALSRSTTVYRLVAGNGPEDQRRVPLRRNLRLDFLFMAGYLLLYAGLAAILAQRGGVWMALGVAAAALAAIAVVFDVSENLRLLALLAGGGTDGLDGVWLVSTLKWTAISASALILSTLFFGHRDFLMAVGGLLLLSGALGVLTVWRGWLAEWCFWPLLLALPGILALAFKPEWLLRHLQP